MKIFIILCNIFILSSGINCLAAIEPVKQVVVSEKEKAAVDAETARIVAEWREQGIPPQEVSNAADKGLPRFLHPNMEPSLLKDWGLVNENINSSSLGTPFRLYVIKADTLRKYNKGDSSYSLISKTDTWYYPVKFGDEIKLILTVAKEKRGYAAGSLGYILLAPQLNKILRSWPGQNDGIILVETYPFQNYFILMEKGINNITRIETVLKAPTPDYSILDTVDNVAQKLKLELGTRPRVKRKNIGDTK